MDNVRLLDHPVVRHKLGLLRNKNTHAKDFRALVSEISRFLAYEATRDWPLEKINIETPMSKADVDHISTPPVVVPIMRAGNGMLEAVMTELPFALVGHIGIYRDKFIKNTVEYYFKLPDQVAGKTVLLLDPMIATGDTSIACIDRLKQYDVGPIRFLCVLASEQGLKDLKEAHPDVVVYAIGIEKEVDPNGYLVPGIGDVGDRLYNSHWGF